MRIMVSQVVMKALLLYVTPVHCEWAQRRLGQDMNGVAHARVVVRKAAIPNEQGLRARPAALLSAVANQFRADVVVKYGPSVVNGKSLRGLMSLHAPQGAVVTIIAEGDDAGELVSRMETLLQSSAAG